MRTTQEYGTRAKRAAIERGERPLFRAEWPQAIDDHGAVVPMEFADAHAVEPGDAPAPGFVDRVLSVFEAGREREIVRLVFVYGATLKTVGEAFGVSESRVGQIVKRAIERTRSDAMRLVS
jgi:hypothetical protein